MLITQNVIIRPTSVTNNTADRIHSHNFVMSVTNAIQSVHNRNIDFDFSFK